MTNDVDLAAIEQNIRDLVQYSMNKDRIPGMSVGIVRGDSLIAYYSFGTQRLGTDLSPTPLTISRVASITKTFTATAILQLRDLGKLELDDPLLLHLPDFTVASALHGTLEEVTLRRMMTHYSGLRTEHPLTDWDAPSFVSTEELLNGLAEIEIVIPQDSQWKYSNLAVGLLGHVIEKVSGVPYEQYIYEEITGPLGFGNTRFELDPEQKRLKATGYSPPTPGSDDLREAPYAPLLGIAAAGQLHSNVEDLAKWVSFQFSSGRKNHPSKVLAATTLAEMHRPVYLGDGWNSGQAIAWLLLRRGDLVLHGHGGGIQGFSSNITFDIKSQTGVIMLANIWPAPTPYNLPADITELVIEEIGPVAEQVASDLGDVSQDHASRYLGRYWAEPGAYVDVVFGETGFGLGTPGQGDYSLHGPADLKNDPAVGDQRVFRIASGRGAGELAEFSLDRNGRPESFRLGGFLYKRID
ncbi:MAG TPA: class A beta-lactamase-related serine hydrolase [Dehalococcoidia bacterium]|nr:class A beta-lactamase-related serine hydrolase [Dehalococcoidia bacterium]